MGRGGAGDDDDAALWAKVTATAAPLKRKQPAQGKIEKPAPPIPRTQPKAVPSAKKEMPQKEMPQPKRPAATSPTPLDRRTARELDKGKIEVKARLDLHGMRQRDAHAQLRRFLKTAQARGLKHVLIITGKGASLEASKSFYEEEERGVLRAAVPHWLAGEDFAALVVSVSPAPRRLGGDGALYVRLRKPRK
jgi:DNA-nicking Smr family endonuclease